MSGRKAASVSKTACVACGILCRPRLMLDREEGKLVKLPLYFCAGCVQRIQAGARLTFVNPNNGHLMSWPCKETQ